MARQLRVAMIAPPWLPIPPVGYGGTENVLHALVPELVRQGVHVELFTTGDSNVKATKNHWLYKTSQYEYIHRPFYDSSPIPAAHLLFALEHIRRDGRFDIIHDHNTFLGPLAMAYTCDDLPPAIHTLHGPPFTTADRLALGLPDNLPMWKQLGSAQKLYIVGISKALIKNAPKQLKPILLPPVHNAVNPDDFELVSAKKNYFITLARSHPEKGQAIAVRICSELGYHLKMAGVVGDISSPKKMMLELANPSSTYRGLADFRYFSDEIFPYLEPGEIEYVGDVAGERKKSFISRAKALLFPIQWDEPFGMAPIEALAYGTPVVAMARGAMPEIIEHGVNGFLAKNEREFKRYVTKVGDIDPKACRESVERKFSAEVMAKRYIERYRSVIAMQKR